MLKLKNGKIVPGSTTILKELGTPYLIKWANKLGLQGIDSTVYVKQTARIGEIIHKIIESYLKHKEIDLSKYDDMEIEQAEKGFLKYREWHKSHNIITIASEFELVSELYQFGGIIDHYCIIDGVHTVVDFKTSKSISKSHFLQLSSYVQLLKENGCQVDELMIVNVPRDSNIEFKVQKISIEDSTPYFEIFKNLLNIYYLKKDLGW